MARRRIPIDEGRAAVARATRLPGGVEGGGGQDRPTDPVLATAVRYLLEELVERAPGRTLEVRVPPYGAVQCVAGPAHTRGTPPNVVETDPETWIALATGSLAWDEALRAGRVSASGSRADLTGLVPLHRPGLGEYGA